MTAPMPTALPYGMRDAKIYPYSDANGTILSDLGYDLPHMQTFSFAEAEEFTDLRGDDQLVATHGNGAQVNWSLEAGGVDLTIWSILTGGQIIETGAAPNRKITLRKCSDDLRPYFRVNGDIISDSGGNVEAVVYRAKANGDIGGQFGDGQFFITSCDGLGLPMPGTRLLYDIVQYETRTALSTTPTPNPIMPPSGIGHTALTDTSVTLSWEPVSGATGYSVQQSSDDGATWASAGADVTEPTIDVVTLTASTTYLFRIATKVDTETGYYGRSYGPLTTLPTP